MSGMPGISFLLSCLDRDPVIAASSIDRVVELFYADRDASLVAETHEGAALAGWQVGSPDGVGGTDRELLGDHHAQVDHLLS